MSGLSDADLAVTARAASLTAGQGTNALRAWMRAQGHDIAANADPEYLYGAAVAVSTDLITGLLAIIGRLDAARGSAARDCCGCSHLGGCLSCGCSCEPSDPRTCPCCGVSDTGQANNPRPRRSAA
jgi:hypothetical protein